MKRVYVDFNSMMRDPQERVELGQVGTWQGDRLPSLCVGEQIMLFDEEMEVTGTIEYDAVHHIWLATPDWSTRQDLIR